MYKSLTKFLSIISSLLVFSSIELFAQNVNVSSWAGLNNAYRNGSANRVITLTNDILITADNIGATSVYPYTITGGASVKNISMSPAGYGYGFNSVANTSFSATFNNIRLVNFKRGTGSIGAMYMMAGAILKLTGTFGINGGMAELGSMVFLGATLNATAVVEFISNTGYSGAGAVGNWGSLLTFSGSTVSFIDNTAPAAGAGLYNNSGSFNVINSSMSFISNTVLNGSGGAISAFSAATMTFNNSQISFNKNSATTAGGAIYSVSAASITFRNSQVLFSGNTVVGRTNDIYMSASKLYMYPAAKK